MTRPCPARADPASIMAAADRGSVTPLVIGMMVILLVLGLGVTAAGSAFLAGQRLQNLCDGAAALAGNAIRPDTADGQSTDAAITAANSYLQTHGADVSIEVAVADAQVRLTCSNEAPITFGFLFGSATLPRTVTATSHPTYHG